MARIIYLIFLIFGTATTQYSLPSFYHQQAFNRPLDQRFEVYQPMTTDYTKNHILNTLLSTQGPFLERINAIASAVQNTPTIKNKRNYLAESLKQSALQSLITAANSCSCCKEALN